jgi:N-acetylglucosaminyldiphosphoundecaprenol N-acetyl-beta-D-mannosaminyltransferase
MGQMGMEWLFRLMVDPQRLFSRYCVEPWHADGSGLARRGPGHGRRLR